MACLVITVQAAGAAYFMLGGIPAVFTAELPKPLVGAATTYFVVNTMAIATAIALSTRQPILKIWNENFLWSAPSYFVGAGAAAVAAWMIVDFSGQWIAPLAAAPLYLTYRTYKVYLGRIEDEQRHVRAMADLLPRIIKVKGCFYGCDPARPNERTSAVANRASKRLIFITAPW